MYETTDVLEYEFLSRRHFPVIKIEDGVFFFKKSALLYLELFNFYYQLEQRLEYDQLALACDNA